MSKSTRRTPQHKTPSAQPLPWLRDGWNALQEAFPDHPALKSEAVYSLPAALIDVICQKAPKLFAGDDERFERSLSSNAEFGFFRGQRISYPPLFAAPSLSPDAPQANPGFLEAVGRARAVMNKHLFAPSTSHGVIGKYWADLLQNRQTFKTWQQSFAGWLITCPAFRADCAMMRAGTRSDGRLPRLSELLAPGVSLDLTDEEKKDWLQFYRHWCIDHLATWDLPVPMLPQSAENGFPVSEEIQGAGLTLFLPWHVLHYRMFDFKSLAKRVRLVGVPAHMRDWVDPPKKSWGGERLAVLLRIYVILELAIGARYQDRLRGQVQQLDEALGRYLKAQGKRNADRAQTIKLARRELNRRLSQWP